MRPREIYLSSIRGETDNYLDLTGPLPQNIQELAKETLKYYTENKATPKIIANRQKLIESSFHFHTKAKTLTPNVVKSLEALANPEAIVVRAGHQPNLLPYINVFAQFILLNILCDEISKLSPHIPVVSFFDIIDTDIVSEEWFRRAYVPCARNKEGILRLDIPYKEEKYRIMSRGSLVDEDLMRKYLHKIKDSIEQDISVIRKHKIGIEKNIFLDNLEQIFSIYFDAHRESNSNAECNSFFMSKIVNELWKLPVLLVNNLNIQPLILEEVARFLDDTKSFNKFVNEARTHLISRDILLRNYSKEYPINQYPLWHLCEKCNSRTPIFLSDSIISGQCPSCKTIVLFNNRNLREIIKNNFRGQRLIPRIILHQLGLSQSLGVCCQVGYIGGAEYTLITRFMANKLNINLPPVYLWKCNWIYLGLNQISSLLRLEKQGNISLLGNQFEVDERNKKAFDIVYEGKSSIIELSYNLGVNKIYEKIKDVFISSHCLVQDQVIELNVINVPKEQLFFLEKKLGNIYNSTKTINYYNQINNTTTKS
jgi:hypothetical protein